MHSFSPPQPMTGPLPIVTLVASGAVEYSATALDGWRDRR